MTNNSSIEFENVALYVPGDVVFGNINRLDARRARIDIGRHAGYEKAILVRFVPVGKRKPRWLVQTSNPYLVVVHLKHAVVPDDLYLPPVGNVAQTRYSAADPRWRSDFDHQLKVSNTPILADYRGFNTKACTSTGTIQQQLAGHSNGRHEETKNRSDDNTEFTEGIRYSAERNFFTRNPLLASSAKALYGYACQACGFDFKAVYGDLGEFFAEVHHLNPLSERPPEEWTEELRTNLADVAVLCANCHRMIHRHKPALSLEELKAQLKSVQLDIGPLVVE